MSSRLFAFVVWAAVAASAVFWGLRLFGRPLPVPPQAAWAAPAATLPAGDMTKLFGAAAPPIIENAPTPPADSRFKLLGVVAPAAGQPSGLALISVDGGAPKAVGVGGVVEGELAVRSVSHRRVELGSRGGAPAMVLELPALPEPARGVPAAAAPGLPTAPTIPVAPPAQQRMPLGRSGLVPGVPPMPVNPAAQPTPSFGNPPQPAFSSPPTPAMPAQQASDPTGTR